MKQDSLMGKDLKMRVLGSSASSPPITVEGKEPRPSRRR
jgi:hypothetical protein